MLWTLLLIMDGQAGLDKILSYIIIPNKKNYSKL